MLPKLALWSTLHAPHTPDRARPAGAASETSASLRKYAGHSFIVVASELAESRGGLVSAVAFAMSSAPSEEWEARSTGSQSMVLA